MPPSSFTRVLEAEASLRTRMSKFALVTTGILMAYVKLETFPPRPARGGGLGIDPRARPFQTEKRIIRRVPVRAVGAIDRQARGQRAALAQQNGVGGDIGSAGEPRELDTRTSPSVSLGRLSSTRRPPPLGMVWPPTQINRCGGVAAVVAGLRRGGKTRGRGMNQQAADTRPSRPPGSARNWRVAPAADPGAKPTARPHAPRIGNG